MQLIVLDFSIGEVFVYDYEPETDEDAEDVVDRLGHNPNNCQWMTFDTEINFKTKN
jgi:hypothetical protein